MEDKLCWTPSKRELFDVRSFCKVLTPHDSIVFPWRSIWQNNVLLRVAFFVWLVALGKNLTMNNLKQQNLIVVDWCCVCRKSGKIVDPFTSLKDWQYLMKFCFRSFFVLDWLMPRQVVDLFACWNGQIGSFLRAVVWKMIPP